MLLEGLRDNTALTELNLSGNSLEAESTTALAALLREPRRRIRSLDLSCNELRDADLRLLRVALEGNNVLTSLDLRMNDVASGADDLDAIEALVHRNELSARDGA
jgi:Leucine-rich repeat (LRR) protein